MDLGKGVRDDTMKSGVPNYLRFSKDYIPPFCCDEFHYHLSGARVCEGSNALTPFLIWEREERPLKFRVG